MPARWTQEGKAAGHRRNARMLSKPITKPSEAVYCVVAFPGGAGTAGMVKLARDNGVRVWVIQDKEER